MKNDFLENVMNIICILHGKQPSPNDFGGSSWIKRGSKIFLILAKTHILPHIRQKGDKMVGYQPTLQPAKYFSICYM